MSLSEMLAEAILNDKERRKYAGRTDWEARQFIRRQYEAGKTNFYEVFDFYSIFTPIELAMWGCIKETNIPFLPQYPVGRYFADFADPVKKLVIECDGKQHDPIADKARDKDFEAMGWTVFMITGRKCFAYDDLHEIHERKEREEIDREEFESQIARYMEETGAGVVFAIAAEYYGKATHYGQITRKAVDMHRSTRRPNISAPGWEIYGD